MHILLALLFLHSAPFWEARQPPQWSDAEVDEILSNSPWARPVGPEPLVKMFLATARPIQDAEAEARIRGHRVAIETDPDYAAYASRNGDSQIVLAVDYQHIQRDWPPQEDRRLQEKSVLIAGQRKHRMVGYFPPTAADPTLRIAFPRDVQPSDKRVLFRLYLPGITFPERDLEFTVKDLLYKGKPEL